MIVREYQFRFSVSISIFPHANGNIMEKMVKEKDIIRKKLFHHIKGKGRGSINELVKKGCWVNNDVG